MRALDLFCGGGGAALGLMRAGYDVVGVDIVDHSAVYPGEFIQADALAPPVDLADFDFIWASPPCKPHSRAGHKRHLHADLVPATRELLSPHPWWAIENVRGGVEPHLRLTGPAFGLEFVDRERHFELSFPVLSPLPMRRSKKYRDGWITPTESMGSKGHFYIRKAQGLPGTIKSSEACAKMGIDLPLGNKAAGNAIPPAFSEYIGRLAMERMAR